MSLVFLLTFYVTTFSTKFRVRNNRILDEYNRESFFHGVNVVYKSPPYIPMTNEFNANLSYSTEDMKLLQSLGQNIVRFGVLWAGVEPTKNSYNMTYINECKQIIKDSYNYGIHTLVDMHQDVLSAALCGEGIPIWATDPTIEWNFPEPLGAPYKTDIDHIPSHSDCLSKSWGSYYTTFNTGTSFENLYKNRNGLRDKFGDYWGTLASNLKDIDGIVGFELMNEPWAGDIYKNPFLMYPGTADRDNLQPFYDEIVPKIYGNDSDRVVFFESVTWTDEFNVTIDDAGFTSVPGGNEYADRSVFSFHYYTPPNTGNEDKYIWQRTHDGIRLNCTSMLTEHNIGDDKTMDLVDKYLVSGWIGWEYKPLAGSLPNGTCTGCGYGLFYKNGTVNTNMAKIISRTYPMKVSGTTYYIKFDNSNANFTMQYKYNSTINQPTIVYYNTQYWYTKGLNVTINPSTMSVDYVDTIYMHIDGHTNNVTDGTVVTINILNS